MSEALVIQERRSIDVKQERQRLARCERIDEAIDLRARAAAVQSYLGKRTEEAMNAAELKLRAERRIGELLEPDKEKRTRRSRGERLLPDGLSRDQSAKWQDVARVPEPKFEAYIAECRAGGREITTAGVLRLLPVEVEPSPSDSEPASCNTEERACGPITGPDRLLHTLVVLRDLYLVKDYEPDPILNACKKKDLKDLHTKLIAVAEWVQSLQTAINRRLQ